MSQFAVAQSGQLLFKPLQKRQMHQESPATKRCPYQAEHVLCNPSAHDVYFKVKATARDFCQVLPNTGVLRPNNKVLIAFVPNCASMQELRSAVQKNKFKISLSLTPMPSERHSEHLSQYPTMLVWKTSDGSFDKTMMSEYKLRCAMTKGSSSTRRSHSEVAMQQATVERQEVLKGECKAQHLTEIPTSAQDSPIIAVAPLKPSLRNKTQRKSKIPVRATNIQSEKPPARPIFVPKGLNPPSLSSAPHKRPDCQAKSSVNRMAQARKQHLGPARMKLLRSKRSHDRVGAVKQPCDQGKTAKRPAASATAFGGTQIQAVASKVSTNQSHRPSLLPSLVATHMVSKHTPAIQWKKKHNEQRTLAGTSTKLATTQLLQIASVPSCNDTHRPGSFESVVASAYQFQNSEIEGQKPRVWASRGTAIKPLIPCVWSEPFTQAAKNQESLKLRSMYPPIKQPMSTVSEETTAVASMSVGIGANALSKRLNNKLNEEDSKTTSDSYENQVLQNTTSGRMFFNGMKGLNSSAAATVGLRTSGTSSSQMQSVSWLFPTSSCTSKKELVEKFRTELKSYVSSYVQSLSKEVLDRIMAAHRQQSYADDSSISSRLRDAPFPSMCTMSLDGPSTDAEKQLNVEEILFNVLADMVTDGEVDPAVLGRATSNPTLVGTTKTDIYSIMFEEVLNYYIARHLSTNLLRQSKSNVESSSATDRLAHVYTLPFRSDSRLLRPEESRRGMGTGADIRGPLRSAKLPTSTSDP